MNRIPVSSSNLAFVKYYPEAQTLEVQFHNGGIYQYFDVPEHVYDALLTAASKGQFLSQQVKGVYRYARV
jgi:hypothetical protein